MAEQKLIRIESIDFHDKPTHPGPHLETVEGKETIEYEGEKQTIITVNFRVDWGKDTHTSFQESVALTESKQAFDAAIRQAASALRARLLQLADGLSQQFQLDQS